MELYCPSDPLFPLISPVSCYAYVVFFSELFSAFSFFFGPLLSPSNKLNWIHFSCNWSTHLAWQINNIFPPNLCVINNNPEKCFFVVVVGTLLLLSLSFLLSSLFLSSPFYSSRPCSLLGWPMVGCRPHHREEPFTEAQTWPLAAAVWKAVHRPHADHLLVRERRVADSTNQALSEPFPPPRCLCLALLHWGENVEGPAPGTSCFTHLFVLLSFVNQT